MQAAQLRDPFPQLDVGAAAGHVRRDGDGGTLPCLADDLRLALVVLCIENVMLDPRPGEHGAQLLRMLDGDGADEDGPPLLVQLLDFLDGGIVLLLLRPVDHVGVIRPDHGHVRGDHHDFEAVDLLELRRFRVGRAGHPGKLLVHPEVVLEGDGGQCLVFPLDLDVLLCFQGLVQPLAVTSPGHETAREFVDDEHLAVLDDIVHVAPEEGVRLQGLIHMMEQFDIARIEEVLDLQGLFDPRHPLLGEDDGPGLLVDRVIRFSPEPGDDLVDPIVFVRRFLGRARDDQRGSRLVDEDAVDLVDDGIVKVPLDVILEGELHVVPQVVKPEFVVRAVDDVAVVGFASLLVGKAMDDDSDGESQKIVDRPHPGGVSPGQVVVHGDELSPLARKGIQVQGHRRGKSFPFARLHLGDFTLVEHNASDELRVEGPHFHGPPCGLPDNGEGLRQDVVEGGPVCELLLEISRLGLQLFVGELLDDGLESVDLVNERSNALQLPLIPRPENLLDDIHHSPT